MSDILRQRRMLRRVVCHRGLHERLAENSVEAFAAAWTAGFLACECDIHASADGMAVVLHDDTLDRTTTGSGPVNLWRWGDLRQLRLRDSQGRPTPFRVPLLADVLELMPVNCRLMIEIKPPSAFSLVRQAIASFRHRRARTIISFDPANVEYARLRDPVASAMLLVDEQTSDLVPRGDLFDHSLLSDEQLQALRRRGRPFGVWTVNDDADILRVLAFEPDYIISDRPRRIREFLLDKVE